MKLILASGSPRRKELLSQAGCKFEVEVSDAQEASSDLLYSQIALYNAELKSGSVSVLHPDDVVIGADTVIEFRQTIIGKPRDLRDASLILSRLSGHTHTVTTGICICRRTDALQIRYTVSSQVTFRPLTEDTIQRYLAQVYVLDKAGAYAVQDHGEWLISQVEGSVQNVVGFPVEQVMESLSVIRRQTGVFF